MSDSDYVQPRDRTPMTAWSYTRSEADTRCLIASHAAADDVMRELAEAVRMMHDDADRFRLGEGRDYEYWRCRKDAAMAALAKYDRMTGGDA
jgi:hypothetical protein